MKQLIILVPEGPHSLSCVVDSYMVFAKANDYLEEQGEEALFDIRLAGISGKVGLYNGLFSIHPQQHVREIPQADLIILPAVFDYANSIRDNKALADWIKEQYLKGAEVASMCTGAFLLASTGLMDGRTCSTHWQAAPEFQEMFPEVNLVTDKIITDEHGIYTNGGAFSFLTLILYLIEKYYGRQTAIYCSKIFQIEIDRSSQSPFTIFTGQKNHNDEVIQKAQALIEKNIQEKFPVSSLSATLAVSRRNFDRRFIKATGNTPVEYQQRVKIEAAKKAFETSRKTINEVMYDVGYSDIKAFREVFKRITGLSPLEYRSRYNKEGALS